MVHFSNQGFQTIERIDTIGYHQRREHTRDLLPDGPAICLRVGVRQYPGIHAAEFSPVSVHHLVPIYPAAGAISSPELAEQAPRDSHDGYDPLRLRNRVAPLAL